MSISNKFKTHIKICTQNQLCPSKKEAKMWSSKKVFAIIKNCLTTSRGGYTKEKSEKVKVKSGKLMTN